VHFTTVSRSENPLRSTGSECNSQLFVPLSLVVTVM
jgi:hypothetical protein